MQNAPSSPATSSPHPVFDGGGIDPDSGVDIRRAWQLLQRRRWVIISTIAASLLIAVLATIRSPKIYRASSRVLIELDTPNYLDDEVVEVYNPTAYGYLGLQQYYETQFDIIKSAPVAKRAVAMLEIDERELARWFRNQSIDGTTRPREGALDGIDRELADKLTLIGLDDVSDREAMLEALDDFDAENFIQERIEINAADDSRIVAIVVDDTNPENAALIANAVTDAYTEYNLDLRTTAARSAVDWLSDQLSELKGKLADAELALYDFKKANNIVSVSLEDRQTMVSQTLAELNSGLSQARADRIALEATRHRVKAAQDDDGALANTLESVVSSPVVQSLKGVLTKLRQKEAELAIRYTERYPSRIETQTKIAAIEQALKQEIENILEAEEQRYLAAEETERRLKEAIEEVKTEALDINKREIEYRRLEREANNYSSLYNLVLKRQKETDLTTLLNVNNVRRFEAAKPPKEPVRPRPLVNIAVGLIIGSLLGVAFAVGADLWDNTLTNEHQIEQTVGVALLGVVPKIKPPREESPDGGAASRDRYILHNPRSALAECARTIRTNLMFMSPDKPAGLLMVTSASPREGKSTTAINLAVVTAQSGKKTLIVDTDMRRPRLHTSFDRSNAIGISTLVVGESTTSDVIQFTGVEGLDLITCGPVPPNPAELLHTERFAALLQELRERYDRVIFDTPPVRAVTDPLVLSSMVDGVVLVIHANMTTSPSAQLAKRRIEDVGGRIFGAVLNDIDLQNRRNVHHDYQYYYYYQNPYVTEHGSSQDRGV